MNELDSSKMQSGEKSRTSQSILCRAAALHSLSSLAIDRQLVSMPMTPEYTEVVAGTPERLFGAVKDLADWVPKLVPHIFPHAEPHEGHVDDAGPAFHYHIHEDFHHLHGGGQKIKVVVEDYNPEALSYVVEYQGVYPEYRQLKYHARFVPGPSPNTTALKWRIEYYPWDEETGAPEHLVAFNLARHLYKDLAAHLDAQELQKQT